MPPNFRQLTGSCVRLELSIMVSKIKKLLLLRHIIYSKGKHMSYSTSARKNMNNARFKQGKDFTVISNFSWSNFISIGLIKCKYIHS
jgi:hypothetical protein